MKIVTLPKGGQKGIHGPVICVACDIEKTSKVLPHCLSKSTIIPVKLKRKLQYKSHYQYQLITPTKIKNALNISSDLILVIEMSD